jgi:hypothetical protein
VTTATDAFTPTLKAGVLDVGLVVSGTVGRLTPLAAVRLAEGGKVESWVKVVAAFAPEASAKFTFDARKAGGLSLHKVVAPNPDLKAAFGTDTIWFAITDDLLLLSIESEGKVIAAAAEAKAGKVGVASANLSVARTVLAAEKGLKPELLSELAKIVFGSAGPSGKDTLRVSINGGEALKIRVGLKGKAVKFAARVDEEKKRN